MLYPLPQSLLYSLPNFLPYPLLYPSPNFLLYSLRYSLRFSVGCVQVSDVARNTVDQDRVGIPAADQKGQFLH